MISGLGTVKMLVVGKRGCFVRPSLAWTTWQALLCGLCARGPIRHLAIVDRKDKVVDPDLRRLQNNLVAG